jgi:hypothetical protein
MVMIYFHTKQNVPSTNVSTIKPNLQISRGSRIIYDSQRILKNFAYAFFKELLKHNMSGCYTSRLVVAIV